MSPVRRAPRNIRGRAEEFTVTTLGLGSAPSQVAGMSAHTHFPDSPLAPAQNPSKLITRKLSVHELQK